MNLVATSTILTAVLTLTGTTAPSALAQAPDAAGPAKQNPVSDSRVIPTQPSGAQPTPASAPDSSQVSTQEFRFNGGSFSRFVELLRETYGTNALELLDIPDAALSIHVPKMRYPARYTNILSALSLYNSTSEAGDWYLGKWIYFPKNAYPGEDIRLRTLIFLPPKLANPANTSGITVRAFDIASISLENRAHLRKVVEIESDRLRKELEAGRFVRQDPADASGRISFHESSGLLVATGGKTYVELVTSLVEAFEKQRTTPGPFYKP